MLDELQIPKELFITISALEFSGWSMDVFSMSMHRRLFQDFPTDLARFAGIFVLLQMMSHERLRDPMLAYLALLLLIVSSLVDFIEVINVTGGRESLLTNFAGFRLLFAFVSVDEMLLEEIFIFVDSMTFIALESFALISLFMFEHVDFKDRCIDTDFTAVRTN